MSYRRQSAAGSAHADARSLRPATAGARGEAAGERSIDGSVT